jgi:two-component system sensor histidine kinase UhpB
MESESRTAGISGVADMPGGTHFCLFYETQQGLLDALVPYFIAGLENNECCIWVVSHSLTKQDAIAALRHALPDLAGHLAQGSIDVLSYDGWYLENGVFDGDSVIRSWKQHVAEALAKGYSGMRLVSDNAWLSHDRAQTALRESAAKLKEAQRIGKIGYWEHDLTADRITWSEETGRIFGLPSFDGGMSQAQLEDMTHPDDRQLQRQALREALEGGRLLDVEFRIVPSNSNMRFVHVRDEIVYDESGRPIRMFGTVQDITKRKQAEEELRRHATRLQEVSRQVLQAQEVERRAIARELHDEIGQVLTAVSTNLQTIQLSSDAATLAERLNESVGLVDEALRQIRDLSLDLRPSMLDDFGLVPALEWFVDRQAQRSGFSAELAVEPAELRMPANLETTVFRVAQIALTNVARHAQATHLRVELRQDAAELELLIRDDGIGFDVAAALERASRGATFGLLSMQERVRLVGGTLEITSTPGLGTEIRIRFPVGSKDLS